MCSIKDLLSEKKINTNTKICGWVKTKRSSTNVCFLVINDGSTFKDIQCVINLNDVNNIDLDKINTGTSVEIQGIIVESKGQGQNIEIKVENINILGLADNYPIQPKKHTVEFLRDIAHLRFRTNTFSSVFRIRSVVSFAIHEFFQNNNFTYLNAPILTSNDCEGAGEMFTVTSFDLSNINSPIDFNEDFFGKKVSLTVSGQLEAETAIFGLNKVYTFGPTFRAENSNTTRHLAEFWMIEPEMAFYDLKDDMDIAEKFLKYIIKAVLDRCPDEIDFLDNRCKNEQNYSLKDKLNHVISEDFKRLTYTEAIDILINCDKNKTTNTENGFKYKVDKWGIDLQSEHERYLTEEYFKKPVILTDYPESIKAFYMRLNDDNKTVSAMDILFPGIGEIIGGSQREERLDYLLKAISKRNMNPSYLEWYLDTRRYGSIKHSGFGLGLDRIIQFITGIENIRDVIPFPRYPKHCEF